jgi:hypothetical protein
MKLPNQAKTVLRVRVPFEMTDDVGLGDAIKRLTSKVGMKPCDGCNRRAVALNRLMVFTGPRNK